MDATGSRMQSPYEHTQQGPLVLVLLPLCAGTIVGASTVGEPLLRVLLVCVGAVFAVLGAMFSRLTVRETGEALDVRFGPLPLAGTRLRYDSVRAVRRARSRLVDGWGIHWLPGRGWTFNLWGFDCVEVTTDRGLLRIGTDDPDGLLQHLERRCGAATTGRA